MQQSTKFLGCPYFENFVLILEFQNVEFYKKSKS